MNQNTRKYCGSKHLQDFSQISWSKPFHKDSDEDYIAANMMENRVYVLFSALRRRPFPPASRVISTGCCKKLFQQSACSQQPVISTGFLESLAP